MNNKQIQIIPVPKTVNGADEKITVVNNICTSHESWVKFIQSFSESFEKVHGVALGMGEGGIELVYDSSVRKSGYKLKCDDGITVLASGDEGMLYGLATVLQIADVTDGKIEVDTLEIEDYPDKDYRTLMVDVAREWHPVSTIYNYIDLCFLFKIKYLHIHFIDDQNYTLPSKVFPGISSPKSYSFEDIHSFNEYAKGKGIILVPEFEAPGHAKSLNKAYPDIFADKICDGEEASFRTEAGAVITSENLICAGSKCTEEEIGKLLGEICEMFPDSPYIHIGGDEANIKAWNNCSVCREYMEENGIDDVYELYSDFIARISKIVLGLGRIPIVWEGFPKKGAERVPRETIVIAWESHYHLVNDLLDEGFKVINASWQPLYIVPSLTERWSPFDILKWNVYNWQHFWDESVAKLNPITVSPTEDVIGAQLSAWELTYEREINFVMENLAALSERTWSTKRICNDAEFHKKHVKIMHIAGKLIQQQ